MAIGGGGPPGMPPVQMPPPRLAPTAPVETSLPGPPPMQAPGPPLEPVEAFPADDRGSEQGQQPNSFPGGLDNELHPSKNLSLRSSACF